MIGSGRSKISMKRASIWISVLLILFILLDVAIVLIASQSLLNQYRQSSGESVLQVYGGTLDNRLRIVTAYVNALLSSDENVRQLGAAGSARDRFYARRGVSNVLSTLLQLEPLADGAACWAGEDGVAVNSAGSMTANEEIRAAIQRLAAEKDSPLVNAGWKWTELSGLWYLVNVTRSPSACCAVWMRENILSSLYPDTGYPTGNYQLFFRQGEERIGAGGDGTDGDRGRFLAVQPSGEGNFDYCCLVGGELGSASRLALIIAVICLVTAILVMTLIWLLHRLVHRMLREIQAGLVSRGEDLSRPLPPARIIETDQVFRTLNDMSQKIQTLQSNIYRHEINEQKSRLQALHMQINSHFFGNCMNIIFSLAQVEKYALIQDFCIYLIDYLKYINTAFQRSTSLNEELVHLENYLLLQQMRYPGRVTWRIQASEEARAFPILPLILLTFIENIFKHAIIDEHICLIQLTAECETREGRPGLSIRIEDNGEGIDEERAAYLNAFDFSAASDLSDQKHGIEKTLARIQLFYGDKAIFHIGRNALNRRTVIELFFPQGQI